MRRKRAPGDDRDQQNQPREHDPPARDGEHAADKHDDENHLAGLKLLHLLPGRQPQEKHAQLRGHQCRTLRTAKADVECGMKVQQHQGEDLMLVTAVQNGEQVRHRYYSELDDGRK